jgi:hypothetical protein
VKDIENAVGENKGFVLAGLRDDFKNFWTH